MADVVVFDFDGTVADTMPVCVGAFQHIFRLFDQRYVSEREVIAMFGPPEAGIITRNLRNRDAVPNAIAEFYRYYSELHNQTVKPLPGLYELLVDIKDMGKRLVVFTGKGRRSLTISLRQLGLDNLFEMAVTGDDVTEKKPNPEGLHLIMREFNCGAGDVWMIGDSDADVAAAIRAGVRSVRVEWFPFEFLDFRKTPDDVCATIADLRRLLQVPQHHGHNEVAN